MYENFDIWKIETKIWTGAEVSSNLVKNRRGVLGFEDPCHRRHV